MKSYTDLNQSEKLAKILPPESADMTRQKLYDDNYSYIESIIPYYLYSGIGIPCWALAALISVLPRIELPCMYMEEMVMNCCLCEHHYLDMDNNDRCELKHYPESNIIRRNWGQWEVDASRCKNYVDFRKKRTEK